MSLLLKSSCRTCFPKDNLTIKQVTRVRFVKTPNAEDTQGRKINRNDRADAHNQIMDLFDVPLHENLRTKIIDITNIIGSRAGIGFFFEEMKKSASEKLTNVIKELNHHVQLYSVTSVNPFKWTLQCNDETPRTKIRRYPL